MRKREKVYMAIAAAFAFWLWKKNRGAAVVIAPPANAPSSAVSATAVTTTANMSALAYGDIKDTQPRDWSTPGGVVLRYPVPVTRSGE